MDTITLQIEIEQLRSENRHLKDYIEQLHKKLSVYLEQMSDQRPLKCGCLDGEGSALAPCETSKILLRDVDCSREYPDFNITCEDDLYKVVEIKK